MSVVATIVDGFQNLVANLGTARDKSYGNDYAFVPLTQAQIETAYRTSPIARKVVDMPAEDAAREWREWQAQATQIEAIEAEEKRLGLQAKLIKAAKVARMSGGAGIYIGVRGATDPSTPLSPESVALGGLEYITVLSRWQLTEGPLQNDPRRPGFGRPEYYTMLAGDRVGVRIHPSRLVILRGNEMPTAAITTFDSWGDSVLQGNLETILRLDAALANVAALVFEAKVDVIKIKSFTDNLRTGGSAYEALMLRRFGLAATAKGINGALLLDAEEDYQQKSASFATLPDIIDRFMQQVAGAADIPMTLLFGTSPGGLNATGDSDTRGYYDRVKTVQTLDIEPAMATLDDCLIRSALGARPTDVHFVWRSLWQPTAKEKAEVGKTMADTLKAARDIGLAEEVVGKALINGLTESGAFPGLEGYAEEYYGAAGFTPEDDPQEMLAATTPASQQPPNGGDLPDPVTDAAPRPLYVRRDVKNAAEIVAWAKAQGFKTTLDAADMHVTIAYSRQAVDWFKMGSAWSDEIKISAGGARMMEQFGDARVLLFASSELSWRHEEMKRAGASWDHPEYQPHITISYDPASPDLDLVKAYTGEIVLGPEIFEEIDEDWQARVAET